MLTIGCHLSSSKGFCHMGKEAISIGANTFQFFTRNSRGSKAKPIDEADVARFLEFAAIHGIPCILAHAPYTLNACSADEHTREFALLTMEDDLKRMEYVPQQHTTVLLETMAGKGTEVGSRFEELAAILEKVELKEKMGVCLDTCHVYDAGYDIVNNLEGVLQEFDEVIGLENLKAIHVNDSKNPFQSHKDRHEKIGQGSLGLEALRRIVHHPKLQELPFYLETPNELPGYAQEIRMLSD